MSNVLANDLGAYLDFSELGDKPPVTFVMDRMTGYRQPLYRAAGAPVRIPKGCTLPTRDAQLALALAKCMEHLQLSGGKTLTLEEYCSRYPKIRVEDACKVDKGYSLYQSWYRNIRNLRTPALKNALATTKAKTIDGWAKIFGRDSAGPQQEYHSVWAWYCREVVAKESKEALDLLDKEIKKFFVHAA